MAQSMTQDVRLRIGSPEGSSSRHDKRKLSDRPKETRDWLSLVCCGAGLSLQMNASRPCACNGVVSEMLPCSSPSTHLDNLVSMQSRRGRKAESRCNLAVYIQCSLKCQAFSISYSGTVEAFAGYWSVQQSQLPVQGLLSLARVSARNRPVSDY